MKRLFILSALLFIGLVVFTPFTFASEAAGAEPHNFANTFLAIAIILFAAKLSSLVERVGQPAVLGELLIGVLMGNAVLFGLHFFEAFKIDPMLTFLSELGVVVLLFQIGLESNIQKMREVGGRAFLVAILGVVVPFVLGTMVVGPWLMPGLSSHAYLFIGAVLTATSVGITARVFQDLNVLQTREAQIVLGAAVIDDVLGLIILAIVSAIVTVGSVGIGLIAWITAKAILFVIGSIVLGQLIAPKLGELFARINSGNGMKLTLALSFGLVFAYAAQKIGLAPIIGAFAAGLVLDPVHFKYFKDISIVRDIRERISTIDPSSKKSIEDTLEHHSHRHIEDLLEPIGHFLVPIFFVMTGMGVSLITLGNVPILVLALGITVAAFIGKIVAGLGAGKVNKLLVGVGMIPRGEVGLIFAMVGKTLGIVSNELFSALVIMIILSTLLTPPMLTYLVKRQKAVA